MKRAIVTPAEVSPSALAELKQWLGITTAHDDAPLADLVRTSLETCEAFVGALPLECKCEEMLPVGIDWQTLSTRPVEAITQVDGLTASGDRFALPVEAYAVDLDAEGSGRILVITPGAATRIAVRFTAGLAAEWDALPPKLRHGVVRLAAHQHRERESAGSAPLPPASVAALWRPFRRMRLS
ncbi:hypothetical protein GCM10011371_26870 [Novosphingobium marinum]|uniref:Putative phiE125 gp8 family phage protein n=1 Tax=Novosphingobium marinum TaxID=1514948 RepID=A0A7Z0BU18_9SPHN|nr:hypothetical protein [Novosphingobium marinum]NYH94698.1 putative phiE125 gp8 family phage protein [Novosphingobium marinum]GGC38075.1 hypothetical protein GCM10011371_26870 [Novosphingobium marinum]